jgi:hypothetical protein
MVLTGVRMPRMNAITERWVKTLRAELLDRTLIWNQTPDVCTDARRHDAMVAVKLNGLYRS